MALISATGVDVAVTSAGLAMRRTTRAIADSPAPATIPYLCGKPLRLTCEHETRVVRCERNAGHPVSAPHHWELDEVPTCPMTYSYMLD